MGLVVRFLGTDVGRAVVAVTALCGTTAVAYHVYHQWRKESRGEGEGEEKGEDTMGIITTMDQLRAVMPAGRGGSCVADALKVMDHLDKQMCGFVERSPFVHLVCVMD